jgi:hypothetical protein
MGVLRVRVTLQTTKLRIGLVAGAGFARRVMFLERVTTAKDATGARDLYVFPKPKSDDPAAGYWSPVVAFEPSVMYRVTKSVAIGGGLQVFLEAANSVFAGNDGENPKTKAESGHSLGPNRGLTTNAIDLASNVQVYVGPFIGMMFGP